MTISTGHNKTWHDRTGQDETRRDTPLNPVLSCPVTYEILFLKLVWIPNLTESCAVAWQDRDPVYSAPPWKQILILLKIGQRQCGKCTTRLLKSSGKAKSCSWRTSLVPSWCWTKSRWVTIRAREVAIIIPGRRGRQRQCSKRPILLHKYEEQDRQDLNSLPSTQWGSTWRNRWKHTTTGVYILTLWDGHLEV